MNTTVFVNYEEHYVDGGEICEGQENDSYPSHEDTNYDFSVESITLANVTPYHEMLDLELPDKLPVALWVVVARYGDGDTFGSSCGHGSVEGVFETRKEAQERADAIQAGAGSRQGYTPWTGYFSGLEGVDIKLVPLVTE